jgi:hypothetical protein
MNLKKKILLLWVIFALLNPDPDSESGSGSTDPIESGPGSATLVNKYTVYTYTVCKGGERVIEGEGPQTDQTSAASAKTL